MKLIAIPAIFLLLAAVAVLHQLALLLAKAAGWIAKRVPE